MEIMREEGTKIGGAFLVGGMIGAALAILYAPKSGKETRKDIRRAARSAKNSAVDLIEDTIDDLNGFASEFKEKAADILDQGADLSEKAKKEIVITLEQGQKAIEKQRNKLSEALGL